MSMIPEATVSTTGARFASFGARAVALVIDTVPVYVAALIVSSIFPTLAGLFWLCGNIAYFTYFTAGKWQATPGKRVMGIYVMRTDGSPVNHATALGRCFAYLASWVILCLGFVMAAFTTERTALHDLLCDTRVVYGKR